MVLYCERCAGFFYFCVNFTIVYSILKSCHFFYCQNPFIGTKRFQERGRKRLLICMCVMWAWACVRGMTSITLWTWFDYDTCINTAQITCDFCWRNRERAITLPCFRSNVVFFYSKMCANLSCAIEINAVDLALILSCYSFETWSNWIQLNKEFNKNLRAE